VDGERGEKEERGAGGPEGGCASGRPAQGGGG
jgi:hypothetical protein